MLLQNATMIGVLRARACAVEFNEALKKHFSELGVNELKRISSAKDRREINTLTDALLVYIDEITTLCRFGHKSGHICEHPISLT